jgi:hypothetical protein
MTSRATASSTLRRTAPRILMTMGLALIAAGAAAQVLLPADDLMAGMGLTGTLFGLSAKLGGALFFGGLFARAVADRPGKRAAKVSEKADQTEHTVTAAALRAARIARERRQTA